MSSFPLLSVRELVPPAKRVTGALLTGIPLLALAACGSGAVQLQPAPDAANPVCAYALVAMPQKLSAHEQRETTAQATTAWGDPTVAVLKCGVTVEEPVSDPCVSVNGVDWILKPTENNDLSDPSTQTARGTWVATTFGRSPAIQVTFEADKISSSTMLAELGSAVQQLEQTKRCTNISDSLEVTSSKDGILAQP